jgi:hypothetical protein
MGRREHCAGSEYQPSASYTPRSTARRPSDYAAKPNAEGSEFTLTKRSLVIVGGGRGHRDRRALDPLAKRGWNAYIQARASRSSPDGGVDACPARDG